MCRKPQVITQGKNGFLLQWRFSKIGNRNNKLPHNFWRRYGDSLTSSYYTLCNAHMSIQYEHTHTHTHTHANTQWGNCLPCWISTKCHAKHYKRGDPNIFQSIRPNNCSLACIWHSHNRWVFFSLPPFNLFFFPPFNLVVLSSYLFIVNCKLKKKETYLISPFINQNTKLKLML